MNDVLEHTECAINEQTGMPRFWSDDFDTDLLKVFPHLETMLGATAHIPIWTISHTTYGRLNCPSQWNMPFGCFIWLERPNYPRDKNGWVNIHGCVTTAREVEGTWIEWLRDAWGHGQGWTLLPAGKTFASIDYNRCFYPIMASIRKWEGYEELAVKGMRMAELWLLKANRRFAQSVERFLVGRGEESPYFYPGSVPGLRASTRYWEIRQSDPGEHYHWSYRMIPGRGFWLPAGMMDHYKRTNDAE